MIKQWINRALRPARITIVSDWEKIVRTPKVNEFDKRRAFWLAKNNVTVLLDVGANIGQYARGVIESGFNGRIISFEPLAKEYSTLLNASHEISNWETNNYALGELDGDAEINIAGNSESSSLLKMADRHSTVLPTSAYVGKQSIQIRRFDSIWRDVVRPTDVVWIKADVQGAEFQVLNGLGSIPKQVIGVEVELSLTQLYEGQPSMPSLIARLNDEGFTMVGFEEVFVDGATKETLQINGVFLRHR